MTALFGKKSIALLAVTFGMAAASPAFADFLINDDLVVDGSACIGFDCVDGESFGFDTIRIKENNLRIKFDDTSVAASFPRNDWQLTANDSANGGQAKFSIDDITGGRTPFTVEAGAPSHSLYVDDGGRIGSGTSTPSVEIHTVDGDTPTLRLQQDGSSGFAPQTWDVAGNETSFFIRDVTNGSTLPFRIRPDAPTNSLVIDQDGNIGLGTLSPDGTLEIVSGPEDASMILTQTGTIDQQWEFRNKEATGNLNFANLTTGNTPVKIDNDAANNLLKLGDNTSASTVFITGDLVVSGECTETDGACADYVFEPGYQKLALGELKTFVQTNRHLPNIPSAAEMQKNGISVTNMSGRLLEKVEELVLYTIEQQEVIEQLQARIEKLEAQQ